MPKVKFKISVEVEVEDGSLELQQSAEYQAARFQETLEARMEQGTQALREQYPDCKFSYRQAPDEGEEWKE